jgi:hypothetical protein
MILLSVGVVKMKTSLRIVTTVLTSSMFLLSSCEDGGGDSSSSSSSSSSSGGSFAESRDVSLSFNLTDAVALVASEDLLVEDRIAVRSTSRDGRQLLRYKIARSEKEVSEASNLLAVNGAGDAKPAIKTNLPIKVMYSVANPAGTKVYLALETGWDDYDSTDTNDYSRFIAHTNCALFEVEVATNDFACVAEGKFVQSMNDDYMKAISGNQKPIQFDKDGNMYFAATSFNREQDSYKDCYWNDATDQEVCTTVTDYWIGGWGSWMPIVYKYSADKTVTAMSQDTEQVGFFIVLQSGELVYQSWNNETGGNVLKMIKESGAVTPLTNDDVRISFFAVDSGNTVLYGTESWNNDDAGIQLARPNPIVGSDFASLDTSLFGSNNSNGGGWQSPTPLRVILGDDGRLYGVFSGGRDVFDSALNSWSWTQTLKVFQILPFDAVPKLELDLGTDWWSWMQGTPFQIANGYLYYTDDVAVPRQNRSDVIRMVNLDTRDVTTLLNPVTSFNPLIVEERYTIYNWRLNGDTLYFSALALDANEVVMGEIDTTKVFTANTEADYLTIQQTASASGAMSAVQDIEVIKAISLIDDGVTPRVEEIFTDSENMFSLSVDFSEPMNQKTVEGAMSLTSKEEFGAEGIDGAVPFMSMWIGNTLHMVPDLQRSEPDVPPSDWNASLALVYPTTVPMSFKETYTVGGFSHTMTDLFGNSLFVPNYTSSENVVTIRPQNGWYKGSLTQSVPAAIASGDTLKFAAQHDQHSWKSYTLHNDLPEHFRVEFSAINFGWNGVGLVVFDQENETARGSERSWDDAIINTSLGNWSHTSYKTIRGWNSYSGTLEDWGSQWSNGETKEVFNGKWSRYRMDVIGRTVTYSVSTDGDADENFSIMTITGSETETEAAKDFNATDFVGLEDINNDGNNDTEYHLVLRAVGPMALDRLEVTTMGASGGPVTTKGDLVLWDGSVKPANLSAAASYGLDN